MDMDTKETYTTLEELANMKLTKEMRQLFVELYIKGNSGLLKNIKL